MRVTKYEKLLIYLFTQFPWIRDEQEEVITHLTPAKEDKHD